MQTTDSVTKALGREGRITLAVLAVLASQEAAAVAATQAEVQHELKQLKKTEDTAYQQKAEVDEAQQNMEKEKAEMVVWRERVVRAWDCYSDLKIESGIVEGSAHDDMDTMS